MKKILLLVIVWFSIGCAQKLDHSMFSNLMKEYNYNGNLDYKGLTSEKRLGEYLELLSNTVPGSLKSDDEKMAFWINAYNAFTIKAIVDNYPVESINDLHIGGRILGHILSTTVWDDEFITIDNEELSLNDIEHKILRKEFSEPRIHFAIVCASISCPQLRNEAFTGERLNFQLAQQAIQFFNDDSRNKFDVKEKVAYLSKILDWFSDDFGDNDEEVLLYVSKFLDNDVSDYIREDIENWSIEYLDYDWGLNEHKIN